MDVSTNEIHVATLTTIDKTSVCSRSMLFPSAVINFAASIDFRSHKSVNQLANGAWCLMNKEAIDHAINFSLGGLTFLIFGGTILAYFVW